MEDTKIAVKPKQPKLVPRVSNIETLQKSADKIKTSSNKLKRIFEKNSYQKKTQLSVLKRYKRRLDSIEREDEERRKKASKRKVKLPDIKKFAGSFFAPGASSDPLKAVGALAAFNSLEKLAKGDVLGSIAPGLVAAGMVAGPGLIGAGVNKFFDRGKTPKGFDVSGRRVSKSTQQRYLNRYGEKAFKNRFGKQNLKNISTTPDVVSTGGRATKAFGRLGKSIIPGVGAVLGAVDAKLRADEGDITGSRIAGASAALDAATAASAATGIGLIATPFLGLASITLDLVNFARDITGMSEAESKKNITTKGRLKEQTKKQKELVDKKEEPKTGLSFEKTLVGYERVVTKFEEFSKNFKVSQDPSIDDMQRNAANVERLVGRQTPTGGPGYEFEEFINQYLTGDPSSPRYDESHGGGNYHDHIEFQNRSDAVSFFNFIESKGYDATELMGLQQGVTGPHSGPGSAHHIGTALDVPGYQWGGSGAIGRKEYEGSATVRRLLNEFFRDKINEKKNRQPQPIPQPRPAAAQPRPAAQPTPQPRPATPQPRPAAAQPRPAAVRAVPGTTYAYQGTTIFKGTDGKYYSSEKDRNGKYLEIDKRSWDFVKKEGSLVSLFTPKKQEFATNNIENYPEYNMPGSTILISYNQPAPQSPQPQPASQSGVSIINSGKSELNTIKDLTMLALG